MAAPIIANYFKKKIPDMEDVVVVSPDHGGVTRARKISRCVKYANRHYR